MGIHSKPCGFLDVAGYYRELFAFLDRMADQRFIKKAQLNGLIRAETAGELLEKFRAYVPHVTDKWLDRNLKRLA